MQIDTFKIRAQIVKKLLDTRGSNKVKDLLTLKLVSNILISQIKYRDNLKS